MISHSRSLIACVKRICFIPIYVALIIFPAHQLCAAPFTPGNLLVNLNGVLGEYTRMGTLVQAFEIPHPDNAPSFRRDPTAVVVDEFGRAHVANYAQEYPTYLSTLDPRSGIWQHTENLLVGDNGLSIHHWTLDRDGEHVYMQNVRFNVDDFTQSVLPQSVAVPFYGGCKVAIGFDHNLYVGECSTRGAGVRVSNADTFRVVRDLVLRDSAGDTIEVLALDADFAGNIYITTLRNQIIRYSATGETVLVQREMEFPRSGVSELKG